MLSKKCTNCEKTFYAIKIEGLSKHFYRAKLGKLGFSNICKSCKKELYPSKPKESKRVEKLSLALYAVKSLMLEDGPILYALKNVKHLEIKF